jgi:hypothetical protein
MPGAYWTQGAVENATRGYNRPDDSQLAINKSPQYSLSPENLKDISEYINSLQEGDAELTPEHASWLATQIAGGSPAILKGNPTALAFKGGAATARLGETAIAGALMSRRARQVALKAMGPQVFKSAIRGASLPVATGLEVAGAGLEEAANVASRPTIQAVDSQVPEAIFHPARNPNNLAEWKGYGSAWSKALHALNPYEGETRSNQMEEYLQQNPQAQADFESLGGYALQTDNSHERLSGLVQSQQEGSKPDDLTERLDPIRAERIRYLARLASPDATEGDKREYAVWNAMVNNQFLKIKAARRKKAYEDLADSLNYGMHAF